MAVPGVGFPHEETEPVHGLLDHSIPDWPNCPRFQFAVLNPKSVQADFWMGSNGAHCFLMKPDFFE